MPSRLDVPPLKPPVYSILLALAGGARHGYSLHREVAELTEGVVRMDPGTLYRWLGRLLDADLVERAEPDDDAAVDPRRRYYRLSEHGRSVLQVESERLQRLLEAARRDGVLGSRG